MRKQIFKRKKSDGKVGKKLLYNTSTIPKYNKAKFEVKTEW